MTLGIDHPEKCLMQNGLQYYREPRYVKFIISLPELYIVHTQELKLSQDYCGIRLVS